MKREIILNSILIVMISFFGFFVNVFAEMSSTTQLINAEVLSNIWYSTTIINENDIINIYAGFQNHSFKNLSGSVGFFVDDLQISKVNFVASPKSLIKLETNYTAVRGEHVSQAKILDIAEVGGDTLDKLSIENLLARESEKNNFSVKYEITKEEIIKKAENIANEIIKNIDTQAEKLATHIESLKSTTSYSLLDSKEPAKLAASVLSAIPTGSGGLIQKEGIEKILQNNIGTQIKGQSDQVTKNFYFYNTFLNVLAFLTRNWMWTFLVIIIIVLYFLLR